MPAGMPPPRPEPSQEVPGVLAGGALAPLGGCLPRATSGSQLVAFRGEVQK